MKEKKLPKILWEEAMRNVVFVENRMNSSNKEISPYQHVHGVAAKVNQLRVFGSKTFAYHFDVQRRKLDDRAKVGLLVGYEENSAAYRVFVPDERKIMRSGHVIVCEKERVEGKGNEDYDFLDLITTSSEPSEPIIHLSEADGRVDVDAEENLRPLNEPSISSRISLRQVERLDYPAISSGNKRQSVQEIALSAATNEEPRNFNEAMESNLKHEWNEAINRELVQFLDDESYAEKSLLDHRRETDHLVCCI
jgi:hypothetical protein